MSVPVQTPITSRLQPNQQNLKYKQFIEYPFYNMRSNIGSEFPIIVADGLTAQSPVDETIKTNGGLDYEYIQK